MQSKIAIHRIDLEKVISKFQKSKNLTSARLYKLLYTVLIAVSALPFLSKDLLEIIKGITKIMPALDIYYYQRIFSIDRSTLKLGNFYVDSNDFNYRSTTILSVGETIQKFTFQLLKNNILLTYYILTLVYLVIWIVLITKLISSGNSYYLNSSIVIIFILLFLGNSRITNNEYSFARLISPQFAMMLWLLGLFIIKIICLARANAKKSYWYVFLFSIILMITSFSYLYSFLSLLGSGVILFVFLFFEKKYRLAIILIVSIIIFSLPFFVTSYIKSKDIRFIDATERMGMIHSRFPGSITTILICSLIIIFILLQSFLIQNRSKLDASKKLMLIMSAGLLLASQSNIITNTEIQFYHFNFFAQMCLMLVLIHFFDSLIKNKFNSIFNKNTFKISTVVIVIYAIFSSNSHFLPLVQNYNYGFSKNVYNDQLNNSDNVIIDEALLQNIFPIYSRAKVLYQADITAYGYSNLELLDRAYISAGCPSIISDRLKSELLVYKMEGTKQKYNSIIRFLSLPGLEKYFSGHKEKLITILNNKEKEIESYFNSYLLREKRKDCFQKAKSFDIDVIIFDEKSKWNSILKEHNILIERFGLGELMKARI
jgi:hypothetical protein